MVLISGQDPVLTGYRNSFLIRARDFSDFLFIKADLPLIVKKILAVDKYSYSA